MTLQIITYSFNFLSRHRRIVALLVLLAVIIWRFPEIANAFAISENEYAKGLSFSLNLIMLAAVICVPIIAIRQKAEKWAVIGVIAFLVVYALDNMYMLPFYQAQDMAVDFEVRPFAKVLYQFGTLASRGPIIWGLVLYAILTKDSPSLQGQLVIVVNLLADSFSTMEYLQCRVLTFKVEDDLIIDRLWGIAPPEVIQAQACARQYSIWVAVLPTVLALLYFIAILSWRRLRPR